MIMKNIGKILLLITGLLFTQSSLVVAQNSVDTIYCYTIEDEIDVRSYTFTELGYYCYKGDLKKVKELIGKGADIEQGMRNDIFVYGAIHPAIISENVDIVRYLLSKGADLDVISSESGITPITTATEIKNNKKSYQITKLLLDYGANPNGGGRLGFPNVETIYPIIEAIKNNNIETGKLLIESGADIIIKDEPKELVLDAILNIQNESDAIGIIRTIIEIKAYKEKENLIYLFEKSKKQNKVHLSKFISKKIL